MKYKWINGEICLKTVCLFVDMVRRKQINVSNQSFIKRCIKQFVSRFVLTEIYLSNIGIV